MSFSTEAWHRVAPLYDAILELPFNRKPAAGTLSRERFTFYMLQDAHYLKDVAPTLAVTAPGALTATPWRAAAMKGSSAGFVASAMSGERAGAIVRGLPARSS